MPIISFSVFKEKIQAGLQGKDAPQGKRQTIRPIRKYPIKTDDILYLWWKSRTPQREKLGDAVCEDAFNIELSVTLESEDRINGFSRFALGVTYIDDNGEQQVMSFEGVQMLAQMDGFEGITEMANWFYNTYGWFVKKPMQVIRWSPSNNPQMVGGKST
jgi:hypothetical protein